MTISGCLGPCPLANVILIVFRGRTVWLHSINSPDDVALIYSYVERMLRAESYLDPPAGLAERHFERYVADDAIPNHCTVGRSPISATLIAPRIG